MSIYAELQTDGTRNLQTSFQPNHVKNKTTNRSEVPKLRRFNDEGWTVFHTAFLSRRAPSPGTGFPRRHRLFFQRNADEDATPTTLISSENPRNPRNAARNRPLGLAHGNKKRRGTPKKGKSGEPAEPIRWLSLCDIEKSRSFKLSTAMACPPSRDARFGHLGSRVIVQKFGG
ncbi:hypothetical protein NL676_034391 [Syzygium grande]|nr:hypothetical protein NL676_034391 [Syzygium grande]